MNIEQWVLFNDESMCQETYSIIMKTIIDSCPRSDENNEREEGSKVSEFNEKSERGQQSVLGMNKQSTHFTMNRARFWNKYD